MQEKIREYSSSSQVEVLTENNRTVLALYEPENTGYVTYIYLYKRKLRELFTKKERGIEWESGQELVSADTFSVIKQKEDLLRIHLSGSGQKARNLYQAQQEASSMAEILEGGYRFSLSSICLLVIFVENSLTLHKGYGIIRL